MPNTEWLYIVWSQQTRLRKLKSGYINLRNKGILKPNWCMEYTAYLTSLMRSKRRNGFVNQRTKDAQRRVC